MIRAWGNGILLTLTTAANWLFVLRHINQQTHWIVASAVVATLYPFIAYFVVRTIRQLNAQRLTTERQIGRINAANADLEKRIRDQSTLFEVSEAASADLELGRVVSTGDKDSLRSIGHLPWYPATREEWRAGEMRRSHVGAYFGGNQARHR